MRVARACTSIADESPTLAQVISRRWWLKMTTVRVEPDVLVAPSAPIGSALTMSCALWKALRHAACRAADEPSAASAAIMPRMCCESQREVCGPPWPSATPMKLSSSGPGLTTSNAHVASSCFRSRV